MQVIIDCKHRRFNRMILNRQLNRKVIIIDGICHETLWRGHVKIVFEHGSLVLASWSDLLITSEQDLLRTSTISELFKVRYWQLIDCLLLDLSLSASPNYDKSCRLGWYTSAHCSLTVSITYWSDHNQCVFCSLIWTSPSVLVSIVYATRMTFMIFENFRYWTWRRRNSGIWLDIWDTTRRLIKNSIV